MTSVTEPRTVVVTGGTSGIGRAIALRHARAGDRVVVSGRNADRGDATVRAITDAGGTGAFVAAELSDPASVAALGAAATAQFGRADVLVNAGGILQSGKSVLDQDLAENQALWDVNYKGTLIACQVFGRSMRDAGRGVILNIGSLASLASLSLPAYTPGKAAVWSLTQILAAELGPAGIRVNALAPGYTLSDGLKEKIRLGQRDPDAILATTALRSFVEPGQVADAAYFLCSDAAAAITGVILPVDAGWLVQAPYAAYKQGNPIRAASGS